MPVRGLASALIAVVFAASLVVRLLTGSTLDALYCALGLFFCINLLISVLLLATYTSPFLPALVAGVIGVAVFWQWLYATSVYISSFFMAGRHHRIARKELYVYFLAPNVPWLLSSILGMYAPWGSRE